MTKGSLGPHFRSFWIATAVSNLGDGIRWTALPLLAASITREPQQIAGVTLTIWLPWLFFALPGGAVVDRVDRRALIRNVQVVRAILLAALTFLVLDGHASIPLIYAVSFLIGTGEVFADSASQTIVRALLPPERLEDGYGRLFAADLGANELVGPPLGGFLFSIQRATPFLCDAISYAVAGLLVHRLPTDLFAREPNSDATIRADVMEGLRWLWTNKLMRAITISITLANFFNTVTYAVFVLFALQILDVDAFGFGLIMSAGGIGGLMATALAPRIMARLGRATMVWGGMVVTGLSALVIAASSDPWIAGAAQFCMLFSITLWVIVARALRATIVPDRLLGRVISSGRLLGFGAIPLGAAVGGWVAHHFGLRAPFLLAGVASVLIGFGTYPFINSRTMAAARAEAGFEQT